LTTKISPKTEPVHPFSVKLNLLTVSRYKTPISAFRRLLLPNGIRSTWTQKATRMSRIKLTTVAYYISYAH